MDTSQNNSGISLLKTFRGHEDAIVRVLWSPSGGQIISASVDNSIRLWDLEQGEYYRLNGAARGFTEMAITANGRYAITTSWNSSDIKVWDLAESCAVSELKGHEGPVNTVAVLPDGFCLLSGANDGTLILWDLRTGKLQTVLRGHTHIVLTCLVSPDGRYAISGAADKKIHIWDLQSGDIVRKLNGHKESVNALALAPDGITLVSGSDDGVLRVWDLTKDRSIGVMSDHTDAITSLSFSAGGQLLASKSSDGTVRLWRSDTWEQVERIDEPVYRGRGYYPNGVAFHPTRPLLATLGEKDTVIRIWKLNYARLLNQHSDTRTYTSAKIALVGDHGVGKTGLAYRLMKGKTTHSRVTPHYQAWVLDALTVMREDGALCEAVLWDFNGQADHNLVHTLMLGDVDIALLLFDPTAWANPLGSIAGWLRHLSIRSNPALMRKILIGARVDAGPSSVSEQELADFCQHHGIGGGYIGTSATLEQGIAELVEKIREQLEWDSNLGTVSEPLYQAVREYLVRQGQEHALVSLPNLGHYLNNPDAGQEFSDDEIRRAVKHLENHGDVILIEDTILLKPELLLDMASAIMTEARRNPRGLGTLDEKRLASHDYPFLQTDSPESEETTDFLLRASLALMSAHGLYFREHFENDRLLIFPELISQKQPLVTKSRIEDDVTYHVEGVVDHLFAALVVLLNHHPSLLTRSYQWDGRAQFEMSLGEVCGFHTTRLGPDELEIVLYYGPETPPYTRSIFHGLVEKFLTQRTVKLTSYPVVVCTACGERQNDRQQVIRFIKAGRATMHCANCGHKINLNALDARRAELQPIPPAPRSEAAMSSFQNALRKMKTFFLDQRGYQPPTCYLSYAWGVPQHEFWVRRLADHLQEAGIVVKLDHWETAEVGEDTDQFLEHIEASDYILVIGTPNYAQKFDHLDFTTGSVVTVEVSLIRQRLSSDHANRVMPLLLEGDEMVFPAAFQNLTVTDFRQDRFYFIRLMYLIPTLYGVPPKDMGELRGFISQ